MLDISFSALTADQATIFGAIQDRGLTAGSRFHLPGIMLTVSICVVRMKGHVLRHQLAHDLTQPAFGS